jgi:hypothetical protein
VKTCHVSEEAIEAVRIARADNEGECPDCDGWGRVMQSDPTRGFECEHCDDGRYVTRTWPHRELRCETCETCETCDGTGCDTSDDDEEWTL